MAVVFEKPKSLTDAPFHYCPGCPHGIIHRLVAEVMDELGIEGKAIGVAPVGCAVMAYDYFACDMIEAPHGRAPAVATGIKRCRPDNIVFTYQGDGDLASIGMAETVHSAARNENITVIFVNNAIYGTLRMQATSRFTRRRASLRWAFLPLTRPTRLPISRLTSLRVSPWPITARR